MSRPGSTKMLTETIKNNNHVAFPEAGSAFIFITLDAPGWKEAVMVCKNVEDVRKIIRDRNVSFIQFWFVDVLGILKSFTVTPSELEEGLVEGMGFDGSSIDLSPTEARLLIFFSKNPGKVFTRSQILDRVWGENSFVEPRTVDVHIRRLRAQIEKDSDNPAFIVTVRGAGYKFAAARE